jgi:DHA1 family tetracycline resistance protein-like MFS transporter
MLAQVSHLPAGDWRIGSTFYLSSALQAVALWLAWRQLKQACRAPVGVVSVEKI